MFSRKAKEAIKTGLSLAALKPLGESLIAYPPMQEGAAFGIDRVKEKIKAAIAAHRGN